MGCLICERIAMIKNNTNPYFVCELATGYVVIGDHQHFRGYTLFLCKEHIAELHFLPEEFRFNYLKEMSLVAQAVYNTFKPEKINYELLGNGDSHLHWHLFPRFDNDLPCRGPVWWLPKEEMFSDAKRPGKEELKSMVNALRVEISKLCPTPPAQQRHAARPGLKA